MLHVVLYGDFADTGGPMTRCPFARCNIYIYICIYTVYTYIYIYIHTYIYVYMIHRRDESFYQYRRHAIIGTVE